jgi:SAM-dependent methyltransferase
MHAPLTFDPAEEEAELRAYLGDAFDQQRLWHYEEQLEAEFASASGEAEFYRSSSAYLYNLTVFAMTGTKLPYLELLVSRVPPGSRILDYGCGIGSDGLILLKAGYRVEFADFDNPSTRYLRWRLARRGLEVPVHDLDRTVPGGFDLAYAFDVIEHVQDPFAFLAEMESRARLVEVNFLDPVPDDQELHHDLDVPALLVHATRRRLVAYRLLHGRSHVVLYDVRHASAAARLRGLRMIATERMRLQARRVLSPRTAGPAGLLTRR